ncbi:MAG: PorV/PorQ family protein [Elusimicrobia bacterium]|nr:PorV/PorQ family protein [Elusimicrobiota bacterium]
MSRPLALALAAAWPLLGVSRAASAGEPGTAGANFLHLGAGPRAVGMGEAHVAVVDDAYAAYWNPASLSRVAYPEAAFMYNRLFQGMDQQYVAYAHPLGPGRTAAASLTRFSVAPFAAYDANGARRGTVEASDTAFGASYGQRLDLPWSRAPEVSVGAGGKWIRETLGPSSAQTFALDLGASASGLDGWLGERARGLRAAAVVRQLGPGLRHHAERARLPREVSAGLALERRPWGDPVTFALDYRLAEDDAARLALGLEYRVRRVLTVRAGYLTGQDEGLGLRIGFGIALKRVTLDYALAGFGVLGSMHRFGMNVRFGGAADLREKTADDFVLQGQRYLRQNRTYEAILEFNQALRLDPGNPQALEGIRQATEAMEPKRKAREGSDGTR